MMLRHLKVIKAKIEQKSIHIMKLLFEGPFKNKYAGRSPERILCLYSARVVPLSYRFSVCFYFLLSDLYPSVRFSSVPFYPYVIVCPSVYLRPHIQNPPSLHLLASSFLGTKFLRRVKRPSGSRK